MIKSYGRYFGGKNFAAPVILTLVSIFLIGSTGIASDIDCNEIGSELKGTLDYYRSTRDYSIGAMDYAISNLDTIYYHSKTYEGKTVYIPIGAFANVKVASDNVYSQKGNAKKYFNKVEKDLIDILEAIARCK